MDFFYEIHIAVKSPFLSASGSVYRYLLRNRATLRRMHEEPTAAARQHLRQVAGERRTAVRIFFEKANAPEPARYEPISR